MSGSPQVAIVGGGTGGLCLAHGLRKAGVSVNVYERGRTRTERLRGYRVHLNRRARREDTGIVTIAGEYPLTEATRRELPEQLWRRPNTVIPPGPCGMFVAPHELDGPVDGAIGAIGAIGAYEADMRRYGFAAVRDSLRSAEQFVSANRAGRLTFKTCSGWPARCRR